MVFKNLNRFTAFVALIVFLLPFQTRALFPYPDSVLLRGDLTTLSLYFVELLLLFGIVVFGVRLQIRKESVPWVIGGAGFIFLSLISALWSPVPLAAAHFAMHATIAFMLFLLVGDERVNRKIVAQAFILGLIIPVLFGLYQVIVGSFPSSTVFGIAERSAETLGDSVVFFGEARVLRAYGTFPHPNLFGGVLAFAIVLLTAFPLFQKKVRIGLGVLLGVGLLLTFSQGAWIALAFGLLAHFIRLSRRGLFSFVVACAFLSLLFMAFAPSLTVTFPASFSERIEQAEQGLGITKHTPILGTGAGNYLHELYARNPGQPWYAHQPVHNSYLLLLIELGIFIIPFLFILRSKTIVHPAFLVVIATLALFDHYLVTQWSGMTLFVIALLYATGDEVYT